MKNAPHFFRLLVLATVVACAVVWWRGWQSELPVEVRTSVPAVPAAPRSQTNHVNDQVKSDQVDTSGKFSGPQVNEMGKASLPPVTKEEAEKRLMEVLRLAQNSPGKFSLGQVEIDARARTLSFPAQLEIVDGPLEYALVHESGKTHETLLSTSVPPQDVHLAALLLSGVSQMPAVEVVWRTNGPPKRVPLQDMVAVKIPGSDESLASGRWTYGGSQFSGAHFAAQAEGSIFSLIPDGNALASLTNTSFENRDDVFSPNADLLPPKGVPLSVIVTFPKL